MSTIEWYLHLYCDYFQVSFLLRDSKLDVCGSWTKRRHLGTFFTKISDRWSTNQSGVRIIISSDLVYCKLHVRTLRVVHWSQDFWLPPKPREFFCLSVNIHFAKLPLRRSELALVQKKYGSSALRRATAPLLHRLLPPLGDCRWASGQWHTVAGVSPQALRVVFNQVEAGGPLDCIDPEGRSIGGSACATSLALNRLLLRCSYWPIHHMFRSIVSPLMENNWSFPRTCCCCTAALKEATCEGCF